MARIVEFDTVSTIGLESSPVAGALAGLRANEARYFKNKYDHVFEVEPASEAKGTIDWVHRILKEERDIVIRSRPLEATAFHFDDEKAGKVRSAYVFYESGLSINVMYAIDDPKKRAVGFKLSEGMEVPSELAERFCHRFRRSRRLAGGIVARMAGGIRGHAAVALLMLTPACATSAGPHVGITARPSCPTGMAAVGGGVLRDDSRTTPVATFCLDQSEVTVAAYDACAQCNSASTTVDWPGISDPERTAASVFCNEGKPERASHPINCVNWRQAASYCASRGSRLPIDEEWEWAARGGSAGHTYPWGEAPPEAQLCWSGREARNGTCSVGSFPAGDAPGALHDLAGNVWEWTASPVASERGYRGGAWSSRSASVLRASYRGQDPATARSENIGFRCAR